MVRILSNTCFSSFVYKDKSPDCYQLKEVYNLFVYTFLLFFEMRYIRETLAWAQSSIFFGAYILKIKIIKR